MTALIICAVAILFPFFWMLSVALKTEAEAITVPPTLFPKQIYVENFKQILSDLTFLRFFLNSFIVAGTGTIISTLSSAVAGYVFAKYEFFGKRVMFYALLATIMIPFQTYMIALYTFALRLGIIDTYAGLIFPIIISSFGIFFMRQNMMSIPDSLLEAAKIDGATNLQVFTIIVMPLAISAVAVLAIFQFMTAWSDFIWPLMITNSKRLYVLELGLSLFQKEFYVNYGLLMSGATLAVIPVLIIYMFLRRYILQGIALTGLKF
jgi:multiple sugar transport system permease protein